MFDLLCFYSPQISCAYSNYVHSKISQKKEILKNIKKKCLNFLLLFSTNFLCLLQLQGGGKKPQHSLDKNFTWFTLLFEFLPCETKRNFRLKRAKVFLLHPVHSIKKLQTKPFTCLFFSKNPFVEFCTFNLLHSNNKTHYSQQSKNTTVPKRFFPAPKDLAQME
jgi:hypothetical protein